MAPDLFSPSAGQCGIIKFSVKEKVKRTEILGMLNAHHEKQTLSRVYD
jgi:hypothetical protein